MREQRRSCPAFLARARHFASNKTVRSRFLCEAVNTFNWIGRIVSLQETEDFNFTWVQINKVAVLKLMELYLISARIKNWQTTLLLWAVKVKIPPSISFRDNSVTKIYRENFKPLTVEKSKIFPSFFGYVTGSQSEKKISPSCPARTFL